MTDQGVLLLLLSFFFFFLSLVKVCLANVALKALPTISLNSLACVCVCTDIIMEHAGDEEGGERSSFYAQYSTDSIQHEHCTLVWQARPIPPLPFYMWRFICEGSSLARVARPFHLAYKPPHIEWERGNGSSWSD